MLQLAYGVVAAFALVGPTLVIATIAGWARCGHAPWTRDFWAA